MNKIALASLVLVVFLAGCVGQPPTKTTTGNGLILKSFSPDFDKIRSGESITLSAMVENVGEADATSISAELFGLNLDGTEWSLLASQNPQVLSILRRADTTLNLAGESYEFSWNLRSPQNLKVDNSYTADLRVYHKYSTSSASTLKFLTYDYLKSLPSDQFEEMKATSGVTQSQISNAPISVEVTVGDRPLVVYDNGDTFSLQIVVSNVGSGNAFKSTASYPGYSGTTGGTGGTSKTSLSSDDLYYVNVAITTDLSLDCSPVLGSAKSGSIRLTRGKSKTMFCTITVPTKSGIGNSKDYSVAVDLNYGYFVDSSTSVSVLKSEASGTTTTTQAGSSGCTGGCPPGYTCTNSECVLSS